MGFRSSFLAVLTSATIGVGLIWVNADEIHDLNNPNDIKTIAEMCKESLNLALSNVRSIRNWPPTAQFRIDTEEATPGKYEPSIKLKVSARVIPNAYYDPDGGDSARLMAAMAILDKKDWSLIESGIVCNAPYDETSFVLGTTISWIAARLNLFLSQNGATSFLYKFAKRFNFNFYSMDMDIGKKLLGKGRTLSHEEMFGEMYVDSSFSELQIFTDSYALMWNPKKETWPEVAKELLKGLMNPQKHFRFTTIIKVAGKTEEEINEEIDMTTKKAANQVSDYLKAVSEQIEI